MAPQLGRRLRYPLGVVALVLGIVLVEILFGMFVRGAVDAESSVWLPTFGSIGQTVVVYSWVVNVYAYLLVPAAAFWLGMRYARAE